MWHWFVRWVGRRCLRWFYRDVVLVGAEKIPPDGPVVLIANHPNDLPDVLIGYLSTRRPVYFIATISAASNPLARATYRGLGVIPVTRMRDARKLLEQGASIADVNKVAYKRVVRALGDGQLIGVFPEGGVVLEPGLKPFRPGVAQMILQCFDDDQCSSVAVVPLGIQYEARNVPRTDCIAIVGDPIVVQRPTETDSRRRVQQLNEQMFGALAAITRQGVSDQDRTHIDEVAAAIGASLAKSRQGSLEFAGQAGPELEKVGGEKSRLLSDGALEREITTVCAALRRLGGEARSAADHHVLRELADERLGRGSADGARNMSLGSGNPWLLSLMAPLAIIGWVVNAPLFAVIWRLAQKSAESRAHLVARTYLPGIYIVLGWYIVTTILAALVLNALGASPLYSLLLFMVLFRLGDVAVKWRHGLSALRFRRGAKQLDDAVLRDIASCYDRIREMWQSHHAASPRPIDTSSVRVTA